MNIVSDEYLLGDKRLQKEGSSQMIDSVSM